MLLNSIFSSFLLFLGFVESKSMMALVFGVPSSLGNLDFTLTWQQCVQSCYNKTVCVIAWSTRGACITYNYDSMPVVNQTDSSNGSIVAFKVDTTSGQCGVNPLDSQNATGSLYITSDRYPKWIYYTISPVENTWETSYSVNSSCTGNSYYYQRSDGTGLCYQVLLVNTGGLNYTRSVASCGYYNQSLASFRSQEDAKFFMNLYPSYRAGLLNATGSNSSYVRVDGKRTPECQATPTTSDCMSVNGFTFVGAAPENFDYYDWVTDSSAQATPDDNCIAIVWDGSSPVKMDIRTCSADESPLPTRMIICAGRAWG